MEKLNEQYQASWELHKFFIQKNIPYVIIGGIALQYWGRPRLTLDVDATIMIPMEETDKIIKLILDNFKSRVKNPFAFARKNRVILIKAKNKCEIDISLGLPGYEDKVIERAVDIEIKPSKKIRICSSEDLIILKALAGRAMDCQDIEGIILRRQEAIDRNYIINWLNLFSNELAEPIILSRFTDVWKKYFE